MQQDHVTKLKTLLRHDLMEARKARRSRETLVIGALLAAIDNAEAPALSVPISRLERSRITEIPRRRLSPADLQNILDREIRERAAAAIQLRAAGHCKRADALVWEADIAKRYLAQTGSD